MRLGEPDIPSGGWNASINRRPTEHGLNFISHKPGSGTSTMPPRKSMPAPRPAPRASISKRGESSTPAVRRRTTLGGPSARKRQRRKDHSESTTPYLDDVAPISDVKVDVDANNNQISAVAEPMDPEKELEHWQDFAVDHYEMVEQLPLELHRNYRLLRELDDGVLCKLASF